MSTSLSSSSYSTAIPGSSTGSGSGSTSSNVSYATDIEGNFEYWQKYIAISNAIVGEAGSQMLQLRDHSAQFVYGGDVCDRGSGDVRVINDLLALKNAYPDRVHIILGNRDINKMRLPIELHPTNLRNRPKVYWFRESEIPSKHMGHCGLMSQCSIVDRLKWILEHTMGSPISFQMRKQELMLAGATCSDDDVVQSFAEYVSPLKKIASITAIDASTTSNTGTTSNKSNDAVEVSFAEGPLTRYLKEGLIAKVIDRTLFLHGAVKPHNIGWLPPDATRPGSTGRYVDDLDEWVSAINSFSRTEVIYFTNYMNHYINSSITDSNSEDGVYKYWAASGGYHHPQPGSNLLQYGMGWLPDKSVNPSVIYCTYEIDDDEQHDQRSIDRFRKMLCNIDRVVVGHKPRGDAPLVIDYYGVKVISGDTSYSSNTLWDIDGVDCWKAFGDGSVTNTRGGSVSEVFITCAGDVNKANIAGILSDGSRYSFDLNSYDEGNDAYLLKTTKTGWYVKAYNVIKAEDTDSSSCNKYYLLSLVSGFVTKNRLVAATNIHLEF